MEFQLLFLPQCHLGVLTYLAPNPQCVNKADRRETTTSEMTYCKASLNRSPYLTLDISNQIQFCPHWICDTQLPPQAPISEAVFLQSFRILQHILNICHFQGPELGE